MFGMFMYADNNFGDVDAEPLAVGIEVTRKLDPLMHKVAKMVT